MRQLTLLTLVAAVVLSSTAPAQDAVPTEMLNRTIFIKYGSESGTAFTVDFKGKLYLVTAKHVVAGAPAQNATIQVYQQDEWKDYHTVKTIYPSSGDVDIAIFETGEKVSTPYLTSTGEEKTGPRMGQQIWFLGYPFGLGSRFTNARFPFIKRGTMSAVDATKPDAVVIYIDGFNNPGFSGGPIIFWDFGSQAYKILGVVQGYKEDSAKVIINGQHVDTQLLVNTGILVGYNIVHAMKAIEESEKQPETTK